MEIIETEVKDISDYQSAANSCNEGDPVQLICEPHNPQDKNAIQVIHSGNLIGYIERGLAAELNGLVDKDLVTASIDRVTRFSKFGTDAVSLDIRRPWNVATVKHSEITSLLEILKGNLLDSYDLDKAIKVGAQIESLRQKLSEYLDHSCDTKELGLTASNAYKKCRYDLVFGSESPDALRIAGVISIILGDRSLGVFAYCAMRLAVRHIFHNTQKMPQRQTKLLSILQLRFSPSDDEFNSYMKIYEYTDPSDGRDDLEIAKLYTQGFGVQRDLELAIHFSIKAFTNPSSQYENSMYEGRFYDLKNISKALKFVIVRGQAETADPDTMFALGVMYNHGEGVDKDYKQAVHWYQKAADQGHVSAMLNLGVYYNYGKGVDKDYKQAVHWYQKAADQGFGSAMFNLGVMYYNGEGVDKDQEQAVHWLQKAADQGDSVRQSSALRLIEAVKASQESKKPNEKKREMPPSGFHQFGK